MNDKRCRVCGDELDCHDYGGGSVWSCATHGIRDWQFSDMGAHWSPRPPAPRAAKPLPPPGELPRHGRTSRASKGADVR